MATEKAVAEAKRFAASYRPSEDDHPDMHSRVVMYRRAVEGKNPRVIAIHARTLVRFAKNLGLEIPKPAKKAAAKKTAAGS